MFELKRRTARGGIFRHKGEKLTGGRGKLHGEGLVYCTSGER
jgi:hypothetical protein